VATTASGKTVYGEQAQIIERLRNAGDDLKQLMNAPITPFLRMFWPMPNAWLWSRTW
jgi:hypothetical protein